MVKLEEDIEDPEKSQVFKKYPKFLANHHAVHFVCDTLRMAISGGVPAFDLDQMMEMDMEVHHCEVSQPVSALTTVADALPGLGIVAAVLGVVITMGALGGPPEEIGHKVAAALVGTFLGILLCYGFLGPLASNLSKMNDAEADYLRCLRQGVIAFVKGSAPVLAVEFARRSIPGGAAPVLQGTGSGLPRRRRRQRQRQRHGSERPAVRPSEQSRHSAHHHHPQEGRHTAATTAARGRWPTPISSPP